MNKFGMFLYQCIYSALAPINAFAPTMSLFQINPTSNLTPPFYSGKKQSERGLRLFCAQKTISK